MNFITHLTLPLIIQPRNFVLHILKADVFFSTSPYQSRTVNILQCPAPAQPGNNTYTDTTEQQERGGFSIPSRYFVARDYTQARMMPLLQSQRSQLCNRH